MKDNFDDLSDDFLNENEGDKPKKKNNFKRKGGSQSNMDFSIESGDGISINPNDMPSFIPPEIRDIINSFTDIKNHGGNVEDELGLGDADETETTEEDGNTFEKKTWNTDFGQITRISVGGDLPEGFDGLDREAIDKLFQGKFGKGKKKDLTLADKLETAIEDENYLEAAELRDQIKAEKIKVAKKIVDSANAKKSDTEGDTDEKLWDF